MEIYYQISWKRSRSGYTCNANGDFISRGSELNCQYGCSETILSTMSYVCTYFSAEDDWSFGEYHIAHVFDNVLDETAVTIGTLGGTWTGVGGSWNISTTFSLRKRTDTGKINSSPQILPTPPLRLQQGCVHTIPLAVTDPDNDTVQCRWAVSKECRDICNKFPGASLDSNSCTITYNATYGTGLKAVAIMVEDYAPGSPHHHPLSSVALQFLVLVYYSSQPCSTHAEYFRFPSIVLHPSNETVILTSSNESVNLTLTCIANETSSYYWEKYNGDIPLTSIGIRTSTLTLIDLQQQDAGNYRCVVFVCSICRKSFSNYATVTVNGKILYCFILWFIFVIDFSCNFNDCITPKSTVC